jgi:hypothetical protein
MSVAHSYRGRGKPTHQVLVDTLVQLPLIGTALPQLLVVVFEALPVGAELLETGLVDVLEANVANVSIGSLEKANIRGHPEYILPFNPGTSKQRARTRSGRIW